MAYDFMKNFITFETFEDEERFGRLFQAFEDTLKEVEETEGSFSDGEIMQALDLVGFNLFRDNWEEFKKLEMHRDLSMMEFGRGKKKKFLH